MTCVLALDLATKSGFAFWKPGMDQPRYGVWLLPKAERQGEVTQRALRRRMSDLAQIETFTAVVIEAPLLVRHGPKQTGIDTARLLFCLAGEAATNALEWGAEARETHHSAMLAYWAGNGNMARDAGKAASIKAAQAHGWDVQGSDDAADALGLLCHFLWITTVKTPWDNRPCAGPLYLHLKSKGVVVNG